MTPLSQLLDSSPEITDSVNEIPARIVVPTDYDTLVDRFVRLFQMNAAVLDQWEADVKRLGEMERKIAVAELMMQEVVDADMPETIIRSSFRMFAKCRLRQFRKIFGISISRSEVVSK